MPKVKSPFSIENLNGKSIEMNLDDPDLTVAGVKQLQCTDHPDGDGLRITVHDKHLFARTDERPEMMMKWPSADLPQRFVDLIKIHPHPEVADYQLSQVRY